MNQDTTPEGTGPGLGAWLEAVQHAQTGKFEDLEANLGMLSEEQWNTMVKAAEDAWEKVQEGKSAVTTWLHEHADEVRRERIHDIARAIVDPGEVPAPEELAINVGCMGIPMKLNQIETNNREVKSLARNANVFAILHQHDSDLERRRAAREIIYGHFHKIVIVGDGYPRAASVVRTGRVPGTARYE